MDTRDGRIYQSIAEAPEEAHPYMKRMETPPTPDQLRRMKVARNDSCPCGSKLKFKKCCKMRVARGEGLKVT